MRKRTTIVFFISFFLLTGLTSVTKAGGCYVDPVIEYAGSGNIKSAVFLRDQACMDGSSILTTLSVGANVQVIGFTDGWYRVEANGARGWIGMQFLNNNAQQTGTTWQSYQEYMTLLPSKVVTNESPKPTVTSSSLLSRVKGYILLQVEQHGEAWYVDPVTSKRYYMKDGLTAYQMMRSFGLGVTESDYASMEAGNWSMKDRLSGRIILRVQEHGEAYYIHPKDLTMYYLRDGEEAYRIMRLYSLGITDMDLSKLVSETIPLK